MSLDTLINQYRKKEIEPNIPPSAERIDRAEKAFDLSWQRNISTDEADAEVLVGELFDFTKKLDDSPLYQDMDGLIDVFDPVEPPHIDEEGVADPMGEILKAEIVAVREPLKWALKASSYLFAPLDRSFKFLTHATMYDPLLKFVAGPIRRQILIDLENTEVLKRLKPEREKLRTELSKKHPGATKLVFPDPKAKQAFLEEYNERHAELEKQIRSQVRKDMAGIVAVEEKEIAKLPQVTSGDIGKSAVDALKALVPWPGFADDVKTTGEVAADSYGRIVGRESPWYYAPLTDIAEQTAAFGGLLKIAHSMQTSKDVAFIAAGAKLTKAEVRAIKRLHKAASQVKKIPVRAEGVPSPTEAATVTQKLIRLIREAKPLRNKKALLVHQDRQRKAAKLTQVQKNVSGARLVKSTKGALKGKAPIPDFDPINANLSPQEIDALFNLVNTSPLTEGFNKGRAVLSLDKLLKGKLITTSEIAELEAVFGKGLTKVLFRKKSIGSIAQDLFLEIFNFPRAVMASGDLSAGGRQGIIFAISHPIASMKAAGRSIRAAVSLKYSDDIERVTRSSRWGQLADKFGVHSSPTGFAAKIGAKEEVYMSRIAEKFPLVAQSERAFTTFLNQQRREVFALQAKKWIRRGITPKNNALSFQQYAKFVNHATGRGSLEGLRPGALTALNATFFSPRFQISRVQVIGDVISPKTTWVARKVIARDLAEFYATGMGVMGMSKAGGAEVEMDWRSSDFGKIKVGETRYNYWGAFQPMARLTGQMFSGEVKQTATGKIKDKAQHELLLTFLRTKLAPTPGRIVDVAVGETFLGEPVEPTPEFIAKTAYESLAFLFVQDAVDAWRFQGADAQFPLSATLAFTGIGVQTWEVAPFAQLELARDSLARQTFGKNYDELSFIEVQALDIDILVNHPGITQLEQEVKFDSDSVNFLKKQAQELRKSERFLERRIDKKLLEDLNAMKVPIGGVDRVFGNWRLNDEQYKEYQKRVARNINELFEDMRPVWDTKDDDSTAKIEIINRLLRSAKQLAAQEMKIGDIE